MIEHNEDFVRHNTTLLDTSDTGDSAVEKKDSTVYESLSLSLSLSLPLPLSLSLSLSVPSLSPPTYDIPGVYPVTLQSTPSIITLRMSSRLAPRLVPVILTVVPPRVGPALGTN